MTHVLAVSSGGGHWQQLMLLAPSLADVNVTFACSAEVSDPSVIRLPDCNARAPFRLIVSATTIVKTLWVIRPDVVISTGAAPGALALIFGKFMGCRTIWIDSIANVDRMSLSGRLTRRFSNLWITQWPSVADQTGATYAGSVL